MPRRPTDRAEALTTALFDRNPLSLYLSDIKSGQLVDVNDSFTQLTGYSRDECLGHSTVDLKLWLDPRQRIEAIRKLTHGQMVDQVEDRSHSPRRRSMSSPLASG